MNRHALAKQAPDQDSLIALHLTQVPDGQLYYDILRGSKEKCLSRSDLQPSMVRPVAVFQVQVPV